MSKAIKEELTLWKVHVAKDGVPWVRALTEGHAYTLAAASVAIFDRGGVHLTVHPGTDHAFEAIDVNLIGQLPGLGSRRSSMERLTLTLEALPGLDDTARRWVIDRLDAAQMVFDELLTPAMSGAVDGVAA